MNPENDGNITCKIDQHPVDYLIDSGAAINTITEQVWERLVNVNATLFKKRFHCDRKYLAYATQEPLQVLVIFEAWISINESKPKSYAEFFVIEGSQKSLLSKRTAEDLKVLKVGLEVKLSIDKRVPPRKIAYLRIPVAMEKKVDQKLLEMLNGDLIEPVVGPSEWISPMVVVPKGKDDIRLCINNEAIKHSRDITTFMTSRGLMRFKRLMFGINCAPEIFQRVMTEMLVGIEGVVVYIDDVVVAGSSKGEHDARLQQVLAVLNKNCATLNKAKCLIGVTELEILGFNARN
ncbi:uncharacterized protein K02A2.6-like [Toxorhynchites rutilus septentrionalis]|uniref:uncharacterized protein K02A2.6-like n=1 Tax=Toxorhynchites rutilus septentrionalis TaxID=329112 RepID=UPI00247A9E22|nr:uncharacterized protein K02A2.6-like [Toxorhynchites rutilus septentrionalis]